MTWIRDWDDEILTVEDLERQEAREEMEWERDCPIEKHCGRVVDPSLNLTVTSKASPDGEACIVLLQSPEYGAFDAAVEATEWWRILESTFPEEEEEPLLSQDTIIAACGRVLNAYIQNVTSTGSEESDDFNQALEATEYWRYQ